MLLDIVNQSVSFALHVLTYWISTVNSSFSLATHASPSLGPAFWVRRGIFLTVVRVFESHDSIPPKSGGRADVRVPGVCRVSDRTSAISSKTKQKN